MQSILEAETESSRFESFHISCFCGSASDTSALACTDRESGSHHVRESCSPMVREEFIHYADNFTSFLVAPFSRNPNVLRRAIMNVHILIS